MSHTFFESSAWYQATTLHERLASLRAVQQHSLNVEVNADLSGRRMQRWRSQPPFTTSTHFAQRIAMDGMTEDELLYLLGEPIEVVHDRFPIPPVWLADLAQAFSRPTSSNTIHLPGTPRDQKVIGFLDAIESLISQGCARLHEGVEAMIQTRPDLPFDPSTIEKLFFANLPGKLLMMLNRTLVLELNVARLQGFLHGDTAEERFRSFLERVGQRETMLALFEEYPVLARQLVVGINHWVNYSLEFLRHLCADCDAIRTTFSPEKDPGVLVQVDNTGGDSHRGGRAVLVARFSSGFQVVYKPKSLSCDGHFQELLTWLNDRGAHPTFRILKVLNRGTYGWVEFVTAQSCTSSEQIEHFYERQGGYLALLYALAAIDFHFENLIAAGEHPVMIDLESLFHPHVQASGITQSDLLAGDMMVNSVLRVGLLPQRIWANAESAGIDLSGLGGVAGQLSPRGVPFWEGVGTDEMHLTRQRVAIQGGHNRPTIDSTEVNVSDYVEAIVAGFAKVYRLLMKHRDDLLSDDGPLARFAEDEVRFIVRQSQTYALLLQDSFHPDMQRNALDRDRLFDRLWVGVEHHLYLIKVIPAERDALLQGDIPMFTTRPNSHDLWGNSNERIADFFDEPGMALVRRRVQQLGDHDLAQQLWFVRASLATLSMDADHKNWSAYPLTEPQTLSDRERLLAAARAIGDRLETLALRGEHDISWIGLTHTHGRCWTLTPLGPDLYNGLSGGALFLAYLGAITQEERYTTLAQAALTTMRRQVERSQSFFTSIGGFDGLGGIIYTLAHLGTLWNQPALSVEAEEIVQRLPALIEQDEQFDVIGGAAGCIGSLLSLYRCAPSDRTLAIAIQCGDRLIACAQPMKPGIGWVTRIAGATPLAGFSHGTAGIVWALLELAALTGEKRFRTAALAAISYERSLFSPEAENWPDLREMETSGQVIENGKPRFMTAWCHGAPGIGLARLRSLPHLDDTETRAEIDTALKTTLAQGFGHNHSLCHGDLGNLELLLQAGETLDDPRWRAEVNRLAAIILESIDRDGWLCGIPSKVESPGLMTGLAGIGYGLLRLAEPVHVPSVLVLAPPDAARVTTEQMPPRHAFAN